MLSFLLPRKRQTNRGALTRCRVDVNATGMGIDDLFDHGQTKSGALGFGAEERFKQPPLHIFFDAWPCVRDFDIGFGADRPRLDHHVPSIWHRLACVPQQVE